MEPRLRLKAEKANPMTKLSEKQYSEFYEIFESHGSKDPDASIQDMCKQLENVNLMGEITIDEFLNHLIQCYKPHDPNDPDRITIGNMIDSNHYPSFK